MQYKDIIELGRDIRTTTSKRGALIQLEDTKVYLTNERGSIVMRVDLPSSLGTGTFYASEAPIEATRIQRRDSKVLFEIPHFGSLRYIYLPEKLLFAEKVESIISQKYIRPTIPLDGNFFSDILPNILITKIKLENSTLEFNQKRSDGSAEIGTLLKNIQSDQRGNVKLFTNDFLILSKFSQAKFSFGVDAISISGSLKGSKMVGLISALEQED